MANTISPKECEAWRKERHFNINQIIIKMLGKGKRLPKEGVPVVTEERILKSRIEPKKTVLSLEEKFAPEFAKYTGKKADTAKIFSKVIGRKKTQEEVVAL